LTDDILEFRYMWKNKVMTDVVVNYTKNIVTFTNYGSNIFHVAFGVRDTATIKDVNDLFEERVFPKERRNCKQLLRDLELDYYSPFLIITKTHGRMWDDYSWIKFKGEDLDYERDIKLRD